MNRSEKISEWTLMQNQFDSYEKYSLAIKLVCVLVVVACFLSDQLGWTSLMIVLVLWLQDAIWKTFQSRIEQRLLALELSLSKASDGAALEAFQFNREFQRNNSSSLGLIQEYLAQAIRPTVAYPYGVLVLMCLLL